MRCSALKMNWFRSNIHICNRWWRCTQRSAADGNKGESMSTLSLMQKRVMLGGLGRAILLLAAWRLVVYKPADAAPRQHERPPALAGGRAKASHSDVPIYFQGLGTVQAFYTVTVTARVDGEIQKVDF